MSGIRRDSQIMNQTKVNSDDWCDAIRQVSNALKLSHVVLKHGTDVEILSLKNLIHSQLKRVANQSTGEKFLAAVEVAIRNASLELPPQDQQQDISLQESLKLPEVLDGPSESRSDDTSIEHRFSDEWIIVDEKAVTIGGVDEWDERRETRNGWARLRKARRGSGKCGLEGRDYFVGSVIPGEKTKVWQRFRSAVAAGMKQEPLLIERDYRYDKIVRNRSIGRSGTDCGEFQHPCDVAVDSQHGDRLVVSDFNNNRVQVFNYYGDFLFEFGSRGSESGQFMGPTGVAVFQDGSIVVCDSLNNRVQIFTSRGIFKSSFGQEGRRYGQFWRPMGVAIDSKNRIIVVDQGNNRVQVFDTSGDFCFTFGKLGNWDGEVSCPNFVAVDKDDNMYVSDEVNMRIQIFDRNGTYLRKIASQEIHGFHGNMKLLSGIAVDSRGYIVVGGKNCCSVQVFTPDGRFLRTFSSKRTSQSRLQFAAGIALTSAGEIVVSDWFNNRIRFF